MALRHMGKAGPERSRRNAHATRCRRDTNNEIRDTSCMPLRQAQGRLSRAHYKRPGPANWVRFAQSACQAALPTRNWVRFARPSHFTLDTSHLKLPPDWLRLASFFTAEGSPGIAITLFLPSTCRSQRPPANWLRFARPSRFTLDTSHLKLCPNWVRFAHFTSRHSRPHTTTALAHMPQSSYVWLCFA